jgi:hypothetical protein
MERFDCRCIGCNPPEDDVIDLVREALANALENGHDFKGWTAEQIADDMMRCAATIEDLPRGEVVEAIRELRSYDNSPTDPHHGGKIWKE